MYFAIFSLPTHAFGQANFTSHTPVILLYIPAKFRDRTRKKARCVWTDHKKITVVLFWGLRLVLWIEGGPGDSESIINDVFRNLEGNGLVLWIRTENLTRSYPFLLFCVNPNLPRPKGKIKNGT